MSNLTTHEHENGPRHDPVRTGLRGRCPRCAQGRLFKGFLTIRDSCEVCGLSYDYAEPADGPAFFVICFACVPAVVFALVLQVKADPPLWLHLVTTLPLVLATCILPLRPLKGWLICSQYFFKAREGRVSQPWRPYGADGPLVAPSGDRP
ncbi:MULTISPECIES: DUF983 domain-containing protein [unclassified Sphingobium]|uniref:DUF983 domain-containing protein n=1 Tax=unclassified Sphingobium TaxID=2611147 RepID=UPI002224C589|nr:MULTISPECIES: DUF983 domain-containing protein [unclassified Sphingobium]MCW2367023.1 uncharacterized protein (DUF983 family) [Sphingobium sp. B7D2B]MCW2382371.1 uncharacterized protein (DUF983 family) [Sphingobium sp. B2D3B]MCW2397456.1 uncharacterized protein (DUF983 family) [Sphingobium sp. B2D3C]